MNDVGSRAVTRVTFNETCPLCRRPITGLFTAVRLARGIHEVDVERRLSFLVHQSCAAELDETGTGKLDSLIERALRSQRRSRPGDDGALDSAIAAQPSGGGPRDCDEAEVPPLEAELELQIID